MTIGTRLNLWYSAILLVALLLISGWSYYEMFVENRTAETEAKLHSRGETPLNEFGEVLLFGGLPALILALAGGSLLMRRALSPISSLAKAVERVHVENLDQPLPRSGNSDELDRLTEVFNDMTERLHGSFQQIREFTLHASHELKTPLTVVRNELDTALADDDLSIAERERCASMLEEIERLAQIVDGLNFITKADAGLLTLDKSAVPLDDLVRDACDDAQALAQADKIEVCNEVCEPLVVLGERRRLRQLLLILTDNAVKYNRPGGRIVVSLKRDRERAILTLSNTGAGLPRESADRVFDRFFRGDASHNRDKDGCGLGLTIAKGIVQAHGGEIQFASEPNLLTTVTVSFSVVQELTTVIADSKPVASRDLLATP